MRSMLRPVWLGLLVCACGGAQPPASSPAASTDPGAPTPTATEATAAAPAGGTVITFKVPEVGKKRTDRESFELVMDISEIVGGKTKRTEHTVERRSAVEHSTVLGSDGKAVTKKRVTFEKDEMSRSQGERTQEVPSPLTGKTYVLSLVGGKLAVAREGGDPVSELEVERVTQKNQNFGQPPRFGAFVPPGALTPGQTFRPDAAALREMFGGGDKQFGDVEFRFEGQEPSASGPVARFTFKLTIMEKSGVKVDAKGHAVLQVQTGWPVELELGGDLTLDAPGDAPGAKISGRGKMKMKLAAEYH